ncbi:MAG: Fe-S cluster protein [Methanomicrobiaceae archaeon]|nr:Fe-S cluster protein [Methanomicrobiaceae archaeon]MDD5419528.1 (Fe-S)-binding protein [Methanomicrobiaceae archaeon]
MEWRPPGKDCGACGASTCDAFLREVELGRKAYADCPFFSRETIEMPPLEARYGERDILGQEYDFILEPLPGEVSARKIVLPFRPDLVERWGIGAGEIVVGRPMGQGCPVQHVLRVIRANPVTGVLTCFIVGPQYSRDREFKDVEAYHVIGFEGFARTVHRAPVFGLRQRFLPSYCMMNLSHTGVVNMVLEKSGGTHVRIEDIRI